jgi:hypothetical protein
MVISHQDAAEALSTIETAQHRSATLRGYERRSPYLILWGVLWAVGYGLSDFAPAHANAIWAAIVPIGLIGGFLARREAGRGMGWRFAAVTLTVLAFFVATYFVMAPVSGRQVAALIPLVVAAAYVLGGLWWGKRYVVTGVVVAALTLAGFFLLREHFLLWMAAVGGSAMILAGLWLRRV